MSLQEKENSMPPSSQPDENSSNDVGKLIPRPPTPPRELGNKKILGRTISPTESDLSESGGVPPGASSPLSSTDEVGKRKKVNFSPWTRYHKADSPQPGSAPTTPTGRSSRPLKSILKPFQQTPLSNSTNISFEPPRDPQEFASMIESFTVALASAERSKRADTYLTFANALRAYDVVPDVQAIESKMPLLISFIRRDLVAKMPDSGTPDTNLITKALKLLSILVYLPYLVEKMDDGDMAGILQHIIGVLESPDSPKQIVNAFLLLLTQQKFPSRIMNTERASSIIATVSTLMERHSSSTAIAAERTAVYGKLLAQSRQAMINKASVWINDTLPLLFTSASSDLRNRSLQFLSEAAKQLGGDAKVTRAFREAMGRVTDNDGEPLFTKVSERCNYFIKNGDGVHVAQIWGLVILFQRGRLPVSSWEFFSPWLTTIQQCFNNSDTAVKVMANVSWAKLIFVISLQSDRFTNKKNLDLLIKPLLGYLDPKNANTISRTARQAALAGCYTLLYYSFRPNTPYKEITNFWNLIVTRLVERMLYSTSESRSGLRMLTALFDGSHTVVWNENRALEKDWIKFTDIGRLDPKWVRLNFSMVLKTVETALRKCEWEDSENKANVRVMWKKLIRTLADAGRKEVRVSTELMEALAHLINLFRKVWREGPASLGTGSPDVFVERFAFLASTTMQSIDAFCFGDRQLSIDAEENAIPIATPSSKSGSSQLVTYPPILLLFRLFLRPFKDAVVNETYCETAKAILKICCDANDSRRKKLSILSSCISPPAWQTEDTIDERIWQSIAELACDSLPLVKDKSLSTPSAPAWEFRDAVRILEYGMRYEKNPVWSKLLNLFASTVRQENGEVQVAKAVLEPLAQFVARQKLEGDADNLLRSTAAIFDCASVTTSKEPEPGSALRLGVGRRIGDSGMLEMLYDTTTKLLSYSYNSADRNTAELDTPLMLLEAIGGFLSRCSPSSLVLIVKRLQSGIEPWISDNNQLFSGAAIRASVTKRSRPSSSVTRLTKVWSQYCAALSKLPKHDSINLQALAPFIVCGLGSKKKVIATEAVKMWNATWGNQEGLEYPTSVRKVMRKLRQIADIKLPSFPEDIDEMPETPPEYSQSQSQEDAEVEDNRERLWSSPTPAPTASSLRARMKTASPATTPGVDGGSALLKSWLNNRRTPSGASRPRPRPAHNDSQTEFAPIEVDKPDRPETQLLTDHQLEVRERQVSEARLFPDLSSSPLQVKISGRPEPEHELPLLDNEDKDEEMRDVIEVPSSPPTSSPVIARRVIKSPPPEPALPSNASPEKETEQVFSQRDSESVSSQKRGRSSKPEEVGEELPEKAASALETPSNARDVSKASPASNSSQTNISIVVPAPGRRRVSSNSQSQQSQESHSVAEMSVTTPVSVGRPARKPRRRSLKSKAPAPLEAKPSKEGSTDLEDIIVVAARVEPMPKPKEEKKGAVLGSPQKVTDDKDEPPSASSRRISKRKSLGGSLRKTPSFTASTSPTTSRRRSLPVRGASSLNRSQSQSQNINDSQDASFVATDLDESELQPAQRPETPSLLSTAGSVSVTGSTRTSMTGSLRGKRKRAVEEHDLLDELQNPDMPTMETPKKKRSASLRSKAALALKSKSPDPVASVDLTKSSETERSPILPRAKAAPTGVDTEMTETEQDAKDSQAAEDQVLRELQESVSRIEEASLSKSGMHKAEDILFEAYGRLRAKRRKIELGE